MSRFLACLFLLCGFVPFGATALTAQQDLDAGVVVRLETDKKIMTAGDKLTVRLVAEFKTATSVPATMVGGVALDTFLDGNESKSLRETVDGEVRIAAGTSITRTLEIDTGAMWGEGELDGHSVLGLKWPGYATAAATVRLAPDQAGLDLDKLDLAKTKVRLVTSKGELVIGFFPDKAPNHVKNFIKLSKEGFYHGTRFHRVIRGFMAQGGCPNTKEGATGIPGTGNPGYSINAEFNDVKHERGIVSMARSSDPNSAGSQFFLMHGEAPGLDGQYSAFGQIESGLDTLDAICESPVTRSRSGEPSQPVEDLWLYAAIVEPVFKQ